MPLGLVSIASILKIRVQRYIYYNKVAFPFVTHSLQNVTKREKVTFRVPHVTPRIVDNLNFLRITTLSFSPYI